MDQLVTLGSIDDGEIFLAMAGMALVGLIVIVSNIRRVMQTRAREATRREIAAYVAEGSIDPDQAVKLMRDSTDLEQKIGDMVAWGTISAAKAEKLIRVARETSAQPQKT